MTLARRLTALVLSALLLAPAPTAEASSGSSRAAAVAPEPGLVLDIPDTFAHPTWDAGAVSRLVDQGYLAPGFEVTTPDRACSAGFMARTAAGEPVMVTAGHCGLVGQTVFVSRDGRQVAVGTVIHSEFAADNSAPDIGIVRLTSPEDVSPRLAGVYPIEGVLSVEDVQRLRPELCRFGARSGISCGEYLGINEDKIVLSNIARPGDSGGPVLARIDGRYHAVGVASWMLTGSRPVIAAQPLAGILEEHNLQLMRG
ncbi:S1 family peptidase [Corynebacterium sp.]|uniref:S1 family peptidase n=1 Tax=Corynebacterium sp. TaxID=1720 RepID=UPI0019AE9EE5|nr:S1 family peptidase [Corynebacterium sp.]HHU67771.1 hypothetical protein [Corynebacterium sp.]